jgi:site-specific DNA recombinase
MINRKDASGKTGIRCAIYARKSSEEGLEQEFNSLHNQREHCEMFIRSQEGWTFLPEEYNDGGYSGGTMERPALKRLLADIEAGKVDCVVVYKIDRLSRSLIDFARMMETFDKHKVSFVCVTQRFSTADSMGRLTLNMLLSFAQFERELASERTRDKVAAARRKGKWAGGLPILGYDVDPCGFRLVVNEEEAERVRQIFASYLRHEALLPVVAELDRRGWRNKRWTTRKGKDVGGRHFDKNTLYNLLRNVAYVGKVKHKASVYDGEHPAIVDIEVWQRVQQVLARNGRTGGKDVRNRYGALLKGLLRCEPCNCSMVHTYTSSKARKARYRYYVCVGAQKRGWQTCPSKSVPAEEMERLVIEQIREIGMNPSIISGTIREARKHVKAALASLQSEEKSLQRDLKRCHGEVQRLALDAGAGNGTAARLGDLHERIRVGEQRMAEVRQQTLALSREIVDEREVVGALTAFDPVWETLSPKERARVVRLLIKRVDYNGRDGDVALTFHPGGLCDLAAQAQPLPQKGVAA